MKTKHLFLYIVILSLGLTMSSCKKDIYPTQHSLLAHKVNKFSYDLYNDIYLWNEDIPLLDPSDYNDTQEFFNQLIHPDDQWSSLTSDITALREDFSGTGLTYGCSYFLTYTDNTRSRIIGVVKYVYADSPAEKAGLKRGDIITKINGSHMTDDTYMDLYNSSSIDIGLAEYKNGEFLDIDKMIKLSAIKMYENPILKTSIFNTSAGKVGYLHYTGYDLNSHKDLNKVFDNFKTKGVNEIILDLRYNGGGYAMTSLFLSSLLTTRQALTSKDIAVKQIWNSKYNKFWLSKEVTNEERFAEKFEYRLTEDSDLIVDNITGNLDLSKLYVLVSSNSASASESTIASLELYLDIILIGENTAGKFCGGMLFDPSSIYKVVDPEIKKWGSYTMIYRFANKEGVTNCIGGYTPTHKIDNEHILALHPIGSETDPQIAKALELITGEATPASVYTTSTYPKYKQIKHSRNMLDGKLIGLELRNFN